MLNVRIKKSDKVVAICLHGPMVVGEIESLRRVIESLSDVATLLVDLTRVTMIDAAGLGLLLELRQRAKTNGIKLRLMNPTQRVSQIFEITRLNTVFEITSRPDLSVIRSKHRVAMPQFAACA